MAQRLVRKLSKSKQPRQATEAEKKYIHKLLDGVDPKFLKGIKVSRTKTTSRPVKKVVDLTADKLDIAVEATAAEKALEEEARTFDFDNVVLYDPVPTEKEPFGYSGRMVIMEQLVVDEEIAKYIRGDVADINTNAIEKTAREHGMLTLEQKGVLAALRGETTLEEISRVI